MQTHSKSHHTLYKFWKFMEHPLTGVAMGILAGIGLLLGIEKLFIAAGTCLGIAVIRTKFFEHKRTRTQITGNGFVLLFIAIFLWGIWVWLERKFPPSVGCSLSQDESICDVPCVVSNPGIATIRNVTVKFRSLFPALTHIGSDPDEKIAFQRINDEEFTLLIPRIGPLEKIKFDVRTDSEDNQNACKQITRMRDIQRNIMLDFYKGIPKSSQALSSNSPNVDLVISAQAKENSLFIPECIITEAGRVIPAEYKTDDEAIALDSFSQLTKRFPEIISLASQHREACLAPVFTIEKSNGEFTNVWARMPSFLPVYTPQVRVGDLIPKRGIPPGGMKIIFLPSPPKEYYCNPPK